MSGATATVQTASARRYLGQFVKHFAHKLPVELDDANTAGRVEFGQGACSLAAGETALYLTVSAETPEDVTLLQGVVDRHLVRFAFREEIVLEWRAE
jgi:hypothetical protein